MQPSMAAWNADVDSAVKVRALCCIVLHRNAQHNALPCTALARALRCFVLFYDANASALHMLVLHNCQRHDHMHAVVAMHSCL